MQVLRTVDLFCGAGGLAVGFDRFVSPRIRFETVLGADNSPSAIKIFNSNFGKKVETRFEIGRRVDLTWFNHPSEIKLFYLIHLSESQPDEALRERLDQIGIRVFLRKLRICDETYVAHIRRLSESAGYAKAVECIPAATGTLALVRANLARLGIASFSRPEPVDTDLPWVEEYRFLETSALVDVACDVADRELKCSTQAEWDYRAQQLVEASQKLGVGQNQNNTARLQALAEFLESVSGRSLQQAWVSWRATRDTIRAHFCISSSEALDEIYQQNRVHVLLGGPPCKGFSRIGRPVIQALREQGVHAWSHHDFGDERNSLMCNYVQFIEALKPDVFLFENVFNFQSKLKTPSGVFDPPALLEELIEELSTEGLEYLVKHSIVNARNFAVPQDRRRFIMIGIRSGKAPATTPKEFFRMNHHEDVPLGVALLGLPAAIPFEPKLDIKSDYECPVYDISDERLPSAYTTYLNWVRQPRFANVPQKTTTAHIFREPREDDRIFIGFVAPGIRWMDLKVDRSSTMIELQDLLKELTAALPPGELRDKVKKIFPKVDSSLMLRLLLEHTQEKFRLPEQHLLLDNYLRNGGSTHGDWLERLSPGKPCRTIVAHIGKDTYAYWHPSEPRALTIREAARVQSFPDWFKFGGSGVVDAYMAIGNAVPPLLAHEFAQSLARLHSKYELFSDSIKEVDLRAKQPKQPKQLSLV